MGNKRNPGCCFCNCISFNTDNGWDIFTGEDADNDPWTLDINGLDQLVLPAGYSVWTDAMDGTSDQWQACVSFAPGEDVDGNYEPNSIELRIEEDEDELNYQSFVVEGGVPKCYDPYDPLATSQVPCEAIAVGCIARMDDEICKKQTYLSTGDELFTRATISAAAATGDATRRRVRIVNVTDRDVIIYSVYGRGEAYSTPNENCRPTCTSTGACDPCGCPRFQVEVDISYLGPITPSYPGYGGSQYYSQFFAEDYGTMGTYVRKARFTCGTESCWTLDIAIDISSWDLRGVAGGSNVNIDLNNPMVLTIAGSCRQDINSEWLPPYASASMTPTGVFHVNVTTANAVASGISSVDSDANRADSAITTGTSLLNRFCGHLFRVDAVTVVEI